MYVTYSPMLWAFCNSRHSNLLVQKAQQWWKVKLLLHVMEPLSKPAIGFMHAPELSRCFTCLSKLVDGLGQVHNREAGRQGAGWRGWILATKAHTRSYPPFSNLIHPSLLLHQLHSWCRFIGSHKANPEISKKVYLPLVGPLGILHQPLAAMYALSAQCTSVGDRTGLWMYINVCVTLLWVDYHASHISEPYKCAMVVIALGGIPSHTNPRQHQSSASLDSDYAHQGAQLTRMTPPTLVLVAIPEVPWQAGRDAMTAQQSCLITIQCPNPWILLPNTYCFDGTFWNQSFLAFWSLLLSCRDSS